MHICLIILTLKDQNQWTLVKYYNYYIIPNMSHNTFLQFSLLLDIFGYFPCIVVTLSCMSVFAPALPELLWLPTVWRCPYIEIAFSTLDCSIVATCGAWGSVTAAKRGPLKQSWAEIQHSRDGEPLGVLMQMRNVRGNGFFFFLLWEYFPVC